MLCAIVRCGCQWRLMPHDLPPWQVVYQDAQRWMKAGCFEVMAHDLRELSRLAKGRKAQPTAAILDGRTLQSSPESGARAGCDGYKRRNGSKVHVAVDTLGHLLAVKVTAANEQRLEVVKLSEARKGFVLLPKRWVAECSFGWAARFKRLSRDYERLASTLAGMHWLTFVTLMLSSLFPKS